MTKTYRVNEIFYSVQGEGVRAGTAAVFVRFSGCNLRCRKETHGFDCDTEFDSGRCMNGLAILNEAERIAGTCRSVIFTGGEPTLQLDDYLVDAFKENGWFTAVETNGTNPVPARVDWISCSPKSAEHALRIKTASELRYVRGYGQAIPKPRIAAPHLLISPAFKGADLDPEAVAWCLHLVQENPEWRLSLQTHKLLNVR